MNWEDAVRTLIEDPSQQDLVRQCYFDLPQRNAVERFYASDEWASVRAKMGRGGGRALDVGAGNGLVSYALARDGWAVTAVEPDPSPLVGAAAVRALAAEQGLPIDVVEGVTGDLDVPDGHYDAIFVRQVFHHAPDIREFAAELARLLAPGGALLTWRDHVISRPDELEAFFDRHPLHRKYGGENAFMESEYRSALEDAGLTVAKTWRHFDDTMNSGPQTPAEMFSQLTQKMLPTPLAARAASVLGARPVYRCLAPLLSAIDRRPGRHVAFLAHRGR